MGDFDVDEMSCGPSVAVRMEHSIGVVGAADEKKVVVTVKEVEVTGDKEAHSCTGHVHCVSCAENYVKKVPDVPKKVVKHKSFEVDVVSGSRHELGTGVEVDTLKVAKHHKKVVEKGNVPVTVYHGRVSVNGEGARKNEKLVTERSTKVVTKGDEGVTSTSKEDHDHIPKRQRYSSRK